MKLHLSLGGDPVGQPRGRVPKGRTKPVSLMSKRHRSYRTALVGIMERAKDAAGWVRPVLARCDVIAYFGTKDRAKWGYYCGKVPDIDNIQKMVLDAAQAAGIIKDDRSIAAGSTEKIWAYSGAVLVSFGGLDAEAPAPTDDDPDDLGVDAPPV